VAIRMADGDRLYWTGEARAPLTPLSFSDLDVNPCPLPCTLALSRGALSATRDRETGRLIATASRDPGQPPSVLNLMPRETLVLSSRGATIRHRPDREWSPLPSPSRSDE